jgi:transcriptional regulator with XRE-family HTH domain
LIFASSWAGEYGSYGKSEAWTQQQLADMTGIGGVHVSELENGKREAGLRMLEKIAASFEMSVSDMLKGI